MAKKNQNVAQTFFNREEKISKRTNKIARENIEVEHKIANRSVNKMAKSKRFNGSRRTKGRSKGEAVRQDQMRNVNPKYQKGEIVFPSGTESMSDSKRYRKRVYNR